MVTKVTFSRFHLLSSDFMNNDKVLCAFIRFHGISCAFMNKDVTTCFHEIS